jgi:UDP-GlcNAc3NAcA epimerase
VQEKPGFVLVYGDTNSTLAGALAASKLHIPIAHVEAGLRSFNMSMPEEINRVLTDRVSSYLFCPTETAIKNLEQEGFPYPTADKKLQRIFNVGDVMYDATLFYAGKARESVSLEKWGLNEKGYALCTIHRAENTDDSSRLVSIFEALLEINEELPVILPLHPRTQNILKKIDQLALLENLTILEPLSFVEIQRLEMSARVILTDSGGMQKEAFFHGVPCITLRDETEWVETVECGWNTIVGSNKIDIIKEFKSVEIKQDRSLLFGDGSSSKKIIKKMYEN